MRLRIVPLPGEYGQNAPYLVVMDRMPEDMPPESFNAKEFGGVLRESSGGTCHGFLMVAGELEIE